MAATNASPDWLGGFSAEMAEARTAQRYRFSAKFSSGYIGSVDRTKERDRIVEAALRATGLGAEGVAEWLASSSGRHMMDHAYRGIPRAEFEKLVAKYTKHAFIEVTLWSHPDYKGVTSITGLSALIRRAFK